MNVIVCVDDNYGIMFNGRRQSMDRALREDVESLVGTHRLFMSQYSYTQFEGSSAYIVATDRDSFLAVTELGDFCFVENGYLSYYKDEIENIILYFWNRCYPADIYFDKDLLDDYIILETKEFVGFSHDKITRVTYEKERKTCDKKK
jgi:hypothetical protein